MIGEEWQRKELFYLILNFVRATQHAEKRFEKALNRHTHTQNVSKTGDFIAFHVVT
jgi:hypothetical protein